LLHLNATIQKRCAEIHKGKASFTRNDVEKAERSLLFPRAVHRLKNVVEIPKSTVEAEGWAIEQRGRGCQ